MRFIQYLDDDGNQRVGCTSTAAGRVRRLDGVASTLGLAQVAFEHGRSLEQMAEARLGALEATPLARLLEGLRVLAPLTHDDPAHCLVSGSAPAHGVARPEGGASTAWVYKGDGSSVAAPGAALTAAGLPRLAAEQPELVGLYWIAPDATPCRLGFALGSELRDPTGALRACAIGPELRSGGLPAELQGTSRVRRGPQVLRQRAFATGQARLGRTLAELEYQHFMHAQHRRPGDVHLHFLGHLLAPAEVDALHVEPGDCFEVEQPAFGAALVNPLALERRAFVPGAVCAL